MAPKKKEQQKMSLGTFLQDEKLGSWADEMEDMPVSDSRTGYGSEKRTYSSTTGTYGSSGAAGGYSVREEIPVPDKPPYTVHLGNLSFDATVGDVTDFFADCECINVRIIEDKMEMRPKGFGYAEFGSREGLLKAIALSGSQFQGRNIRVSVADPPKQGDRPDAPREITDWTRRGPLPDLPSRAGPDRRGSDRGFGTGRTFGDAGSEAGGERRERAPYAPQDDGKVRDFGNWERRGPLAPLPQQERQPSSRDGGRPGTNDGPRTERSPAAWGEGRGQGSQDGSRPPRREFQERPVVERTPTAAEQDNQWRTKMKPDAPAAAPISAAPSRDGSEAPPSPAVASAPAGRPKLQLAKRTVSEAVDTSLSSVGGDAKASPFGAARPIDTAAKEKEIEEKRLAAIQEKKEAEDKAKEEKRLAKEAAKAKEENIAGEKEDAVAPDAAKVEILQREGKTETIETEHANGEVVDDKAVKPKEVTRDIRPKPSDTGAWRRPSGGPKPPQTDQRGPRGRGDGPPRGSRNDGPRPQRTNGGSSTPASPTVATNSETATVEDDGWSTVSKPKKGGRGPARALAS